MQMMPLNKVKRHIRTPPKQQICANSSIQVPFLLRKLLFAHNVQPGSLRKPIQFENQFQAANI